MTRTLPGFSATQLLRAVSPTTPGPAPRPHGRAERRRDRLFRLLRVVAALAGAGAAAGLQAAPPVAERFPEPRLALFYTDVSEAELDSPAGAAVRGSEYALDVAPLPWQRAGGLQVGLSYDYVHQEFAGISGEARDLHRLFFPLRWTSAGDGRDWRVQLNPGIATSSNKFKRWDRLDSDDFLLTGSWIMRWRRPEGPTWVVGVAGDHSFGAFRFYPVIGARLHPGPRWRIDALFPRPALEYSPGERLALGLGAEPAGGQWNVLSRALDRDLRFRREAWRAQGYARWNLGHRLWLHFRAGLEFDRKFDVSDTAGRRVVTGLESAWTAGVGLTLER
ncbi:MAG: hypothetical protein P8102_07660 [Gammaproteobacteria bacterium]